MAKKYKKLAILVPTYKTVSANTFHCYSVLIARLYKVGFDPSFFFIDQTNVAISRNKLAKFFVESHRSEHGPFSVAFCLDSDHTFLFDDFMNLLFHYDSVNKSDGVKILSARYITRDVNNPKVCAFMKHEFKPENPEHKPYFAYKAVMPDTKGIVEVDGVGFGFIMVAPEVFEKMYEVYGEHQFLFRAVGPKEGGGIIGEDLDWCDKAQEQGYKIYLDNDVSIGHYGGIIDDKVFTRMH